jgi:hypothetical protein
MSAGSFCPSPSSTTITSPDACSMPAATAAVWPKLRRKRITLIDSSFAASSARISGLRSWLPSSTNRSSDGSDIPISAEVSSSNSGSRFCSSLQTGITTEIFGATPKRIGAPGLSIE